MDMDKDLLNQYKLMDTPQIKGESLDPGDQRVNQSKANWMLNMTNPETH